MPAMKVVLGTFARRGIESQLGSDVRAAVHAALCHYSSSLAAGRPPVAPPRFIAELEGDGAPKETMNLTVEPEVEASLRREAARCGIGIDQIASHSVLVYLAELDFLATSSRPV